jgi:predicted deacylase
VYPSSYHDSRDRFRQLIDRVAARWPTTRSISHAPDGDEYTIDAITAEAIDSPVQRLIITTGQHGIEGYLGSVFLHWFAAEFLPQIDPRRTGLLLVHVINPWGMAQRRRVNRSNVDVNRNFRAVGDDFASDANSDYAQLQALLNPTGQIKSIGRSNARLGAALLPQVVKIGTGRIQAAFTLGQYRFPRGVYYGGEVLQPETQFMIDLYREQWRGCQQVIHLDVHTGYGPRDQMSLVNSPLEPRSSEELVRAFDYPLIVKALPGEFYAMRGDMIDFVYRLQQAEFPALKLYATTLEFGTFGTSLSAGLRSLRALVLENQLHHYGAVNDRVRAQVQHEFAELFMPSDAAWQVKAHADARQAMEGILRAKGLC